MSNEIKYDDIVHPEKLEAKDPQKYQRLIFARRVGYVVLITSFLLSFLLALMVDIYTPVRYFDTFCLFFFWVVFALVGTKLSHKIQIIRYGDVILQDQEERKSLHKKKMSEPEEIVKFAKSGKWLNDFYELRFRMIFFYAILSFLGLGLAKNNMLSPILSVMTIPIAYSLALLTYRKKDFFLNQGLSFYIPVTFMFLVFELLFLGIGMIFMPQEYAVVIAVFPALYVSMLLLRSLNKTMAVQNTEEYRTRFRRKPH